MHGLGDLRRLRDQADSGAAVRNVSREKVRTVEPKPTAAVTLEPVGPRTHRPRRHAVRLVLQFTGAEPRFADRSWVVGMARSALVALSSSIEHEAPELGDLLGKTGSVVGIEGVMTCADKPDATLIGQLKQVLADAGYGFSARELRECSEADCTTTFSVDRDRPLDVPAGWYSASVCGRHSYKPCPVCASTYVMSCANATRAAPSVHCEVCGWILVEWGGTKVWTADLVRRADWPRS